MKLKNKIVIITGATSGIGKACAELFVREGAKVVVSGLNKEKGGQIAKQIGGVFIKADVSKMKDIQNLINKTVKIFGRVDVMFNNAGVYRFAQSLAETKDDDVKKTIAINLNGVIFGSKYAVQQMLKQKSGGAILSTASILGLYGEDGSVDYCASKAGIINMTRALALEVACHNIRVNCICPGPIETSLLSAFFKNKNEERKYLRVSNPMGRAGTPKEVAQVALFLVSDDASYVTGAAYTVDGGASAK